MAKKVKITDKPTKKKLSADDAKGVVGGYEVQTKMASTVYTKDVKKDPFGSSEPRVIDRSSSTAALGRLVGLRRTPTK